MYQCFLLISISSCVTADQEYVITGWSLSIHHSAFWIHSPSSSTTWSALDTVPPGLHRSASTLGSKYSSGESNTTPHVTKVSTHVLLQVRPIETPINKDLFVCIVPPHSIYVLYKPTPASNASSAATRWQPLLSSKVKMTPINNVGMWKESSNHRLSRMGVMVYCQKSITAIL